MEFSSGRGAAWRFKQYAIKQLQTAVRGSDRAKRSIGLRGLADIAGAAVGRIFRSEPIEEGVLWLLIAAVAWVPFWYGSNDWLAWGVNAIVFPGLAAIYELSLLLRDKPHPVAIRYLAVPAALFAAVISWSAIQAVTWLPAVLVNPIWRMASDALGDPIAGSISVNRDLTALAIVKLITAASGFWLALQISRDAKRAERLLAAVGTIAALYSLEGLMAMRFGQVPWLSYIDTTSHTLSATFIDPDTFATYAAIGLVVIAAFVLRHYGAAMRKGAGNRRLQFAFFIERTGGQGALLLSGAFVLLVALLLSGSRGGLLGAAFGLFVLGALMRRRQEHGKTPFLLLAIGAGSVVAILFAFGSMVGAKFEAGGFYDANRFSVYILTLRSIFNEPLLGYGYGTFADVFPMYRDRTISAHGTWLQAHDTYLELFQGLGIVFGAMLISCVTIIALRCFKGATRRQHDITAPVVAISATAVVAVHALVDFSLQIQAVALTLAILLGTGAAQAESSRIALGD